MEYKFSKPIDPLSYETQGLCGNFPLRQHKHSHVEDAAISRAQDDWKRLVGPLSDYRGGLGPRFSFIQVTVPECIPDRLDVISYANEFAFLYDDAVEHLQQLSEAAKANRHAILDVFKTKIDADRGIEVAKHGAKIMQMNVFTEMEKIDPQRAEVSTKAWMSCVEEAASRPRSQPFRSLQEYLPWRVADAGEKLWFGTVTFGMALTIPEHEMGLSSKLGWDAFAVLALTNDLFSWDKELREASSAGFERVVNAIWILMEECDCGEQRAKQLCRAAIMDHLVKYARTVEETKVNAMISADLKTYIEALQLSISGNLVWSLTCPRYSPMLMEKSSEQSTTGGPEGRL